MIATPHGTIEILGYERSRDTGRYVWRLERWTGNADGRKVNERSMCTGKGDASPRRSTYPTGYDSKCSACYLGATHTEDLHAAKVAS